MIRSPRNLILVPLLAGACASLPGPSSAPPRAGTPDPTSFSLATGPDALPAGWAPFRITRLKKPTEYRLVNVEGGVAMKATADASASGLQFETVADLNEYPWLTWTWKVPELNELANNSVAHAEDSPARILVVFEGGRDSLPEAERFNYDLAKALGGNGLPFATIMYIWSSDSPEGDVIGHHLTTRIKMIVAGSGRRGLGTWQKKRVNLLADYRRAFGEEPPRVRAVGIMSDSDNTGARSVAYFGDIRFERR